MHYRGCLSSPLGIPIVVLSAPGLRPSRSSIDPSIPVAKTLPAVQGDALRSRRYNSSLSRNDPWMRAPTLFLFSPFLSLPGIEPLLDRTLEGDLPVAGAATSEDEPNERCLVAAWKDRRFSRSIVHYEKQKYTDRQYLHPNNRPNYTFFWISLSSFLIQRQERRAFVARRNVQGHTSTVELNGRPRWNRRVCSWVFSMTRDSNEIWRTKKERRRPKE